PRMYALLLGVFPVLGVTKALIGIYGVMSSTVSQRIRELGIRMALRARPAMVLGLVLRHSLMLTFVGVALGLLGTATLSEALETMLFELEPLDPATFSGVRRVF